MKPSDIVFNPSTASNDKGPQARWKSFIDACDNEGETWWTGKKTARVGDLYLFWFSSPKKCIAGVGVHDGEVYGKTNWRNPEIGFVVTSLREPIGIELIQTDPVLTGWWAGQPFWGGPKTIKQASVARRLLELIINRNPAMSNLLSPYHDQTNFLPQPLSPQKARQWSSRASRLSIEEQDRIYRMILRAERDRDLRPRVLALWGNACAACGATLSVRLGGPWECEVAHVREVNAKGSDDVDNAFPVCRTHHWAFDQRLWAIDPKTMRIVVAKSHRKSSPLAKLHGKPLTSERSSGPPLLSRDLLRERYKALVD